MNIVKNIIKSITDLLFLRPMSYLMSEGDKCKNMFIKPLYFIACMIVLLFNIIILLGLFGILALGLLIIISVILSPLANYPNLQLAVFISIIIYAVCFYLVNFAIKEDE